MVVVFLTDPDTVILIRNALKKQNKIDLKKATEQETNRRTAITMFFLAASHSCDFCNRHQQTHFGFIIEIRGG